MSRLEEIEQAVKQLPLSELSRLAALIDRRRWQLETSQSAGGNPSPGGSGPGRMIIREHTAFLNSYAPEDEGLYDDAAGR